jgi:hypothetical protein
MQQTPPRRRPPPPKKKVKRAGPGRGKKKVVFVEGAVEQGTSTSNIGSDSLAVPGVKREEGSAAPSDGGDTPMADAGGEEEEGSGEEGSEDEDQDMEHISTPTTPLRLSAAPTNAPTLETSNFPDTNPAEAPAAATPPPATPNQPSQTTAETEQPAMPTDVPEPEAPEQAASRDGSSSPDLPLSGVTHSRQNSDHQIPTSAPTTETVVPEEAPSELPAPTVEADVAPAPVVASEPEVVQDSPAVPSAPTSEPDLMGSLERHLENETHDATGS